MFVLIDNTCKIKIKCNRAPQGRMEENEHNLLGNYASFVKKTSTFVL